MLDLIKKKFPSFTLIVISLIVGLALFLDSKFIAGGCVLLFITIPLIAYFTDPFITPPEYSQEDLTALHSSSSVDYYSNRSLGVSTSSKGFSIDDNSCWDGGGHGV